MNNRYFAGRQISAEIYDGKTRYEKSGARTTMTEEEDENEKQGWNVMQNGSKKAVVKMMMTTTTSLDICGTWTQTNAWGIREVTQKEKCPTCKVESFITPPPCSPLCCFHISFTFFSFFSLFSHSHTLCFFTFLHYPSHATSISTQGRKNKERH